jgi:hypothetical protein
MMIENQSSLRYSREPYYAVIAGTLLMTMRKEGREKDAGRGGGGGGR